MMTPSRAEQALCGLDKTRDGVQVAEWKGLRFTVSVPPACRKGGCGLIVDLHGATMDAESEDQETQLRALAAAGVTRGAPKPFVVIQPSANGDPPQWTTPDASTIYQFAECVGRELHLAGQMRHIAAFSQGGRTAAHILCDYPGRFASVALAAGGGNILAECLPEMAGKTPALLYVHGVQDVVVSPKHAVALVDAAKRTAGADLEITKVSDAETRYTSGSFFMDVILHSFSGGIAGGHCVPGGKGRVGCPADFAFGERAIDFFIAHPGRQ